MDSSIVVKKELSENTETSKENPDDLQFLIEQNLVSVKTEVKTEASEEVEQDLKPDPDQDSNSNTPAKQKYCALCQKLSNHSTSKCPKLKCKSCGGQGHAQKDCTAAPDVQDLVKVEIKPEPEEEEILHPEAFEEYESNPNPDADDVAQETEEPSSFSTKPKNLDVFHKVRNLNKGRIKNYESGKGELVSNDGKIYKFTQKSPDLKAKSFVVFEVFDPEKLIAKNVQRLNSLISTGDTIESHAPADDNDNLVDSAIEPFPKNQDSEEEMMANYWADLRHDLRKRKETKGQDDLRELMNKRKRLPVNEEEGSPCKKRRRRRRRRKRPEPDSQFPVCILDAQFLYKGHDEHLTQIGAVILDGSRVSTFFRPVIPPGLSLGGVYTRALRISTKGKFVHKDGNHLDCYTEEDALKQFIGLCDDTRIKGDEGLGLLVADGDSVLPQLMRRLETYGLAGKFGRRIKWITDVKSILNSKDQLRFLTSFCGTRFGHVEDFIRGTSERKLINADSSCDINASCIWLTMERLFNVEDLQESREFYSFFNNGKSFMEKLKKDRLVSRQPLLQCCASTIRL